MELEVLQIIGSSHTSDFVKYLGILIDPYLNWNHHTDFIAPKFTRALGMLTKIKYYVVTTLRSIYFLLLSSVMFYGAHIWGQMVNKHVNWIINCKIVQ